MKSLALSLSLAVLAGCGVAYAEQAALPDHGWGGPGAVSVTRAQAQEMAASMFERLDFNHDGKLDEVDREAREAEFKRALFEKIDANHDGQISREEFVNFKPVRPKAPMDGHDMHGPMGGPGMEGPGGPGGEGPPMGMPGPGMGMGGMGMGGMMMRMADANHDGVITRDEFMAAFMQHFDRMDANHDGTVTPEERRAARDSMRQQMHDRGPGKGGMDGHDMDGHDRDGHERGGPDGAMPPPPEGN